MNKKLYLVFGASLFVAGMAVGVYYATNGVPNLTSTRPRSAEEDLMTTKRRVETAEAERIGSALGLDWAQVDLEQFRIGLEVELEHGKRDPETNVTDDDMMLTGKIALAHIREFPDYYTRLEKMEAEAEEFWAEKQEKP